MHEALVEISLTWQTLRFPIRTARLRCLSRRRTIFYISATTAIKLSNKIDLHALHVLIGTIVQRACPTPRLRTRCTNSYPRTPI